MSDDVALREAIEEHHLMLCRAADRIERDGAPYTANIIRIAAHELKNIALNRLTGMRGDGTSAEEF